MGLALLLRAEKGRNCRFAGVDVRVEWRGGPGWDFGNEKSGRRPACVEGLEALALRLESGMVPLQPGLNSAAAAATAGAAAALPESGSCHGGKKIRSSLGPCRCDRKGTPEHRHRNPCSSRS